MKTKNSTKRQLCCWLVEFLIFNSIYSKISVPSNGRNRVKLKSEYLNPFLPFFCFFYGQESVISTTLSRIFHFFHTQKCFFTCPILSLADFFMGRNFTFQFIKSDFYLSTHENFDIIAFFENFQQQKMLLTPTFFVNFQNFSRVHFCFSKPK